MKKKEGKKITDSKVLIQRNYLVWLARFHLGMQVEEIADAFKISRQAVFDIFEKTSHYQ